MDDLHALALECGAIPGTLRTRRWGVSFRVEAMGPGYTWPAAFVLRPDGSVVELFEGCRQVCSSMAELRRLALGE